MALISLVPLLFGAEGFKPLFPSALLLIRDDFLLIHKELTIKNMLSFLLFMLTKWD